MAYRRKTYKKRFTKRRKPFYKKRFVKKYRANKTSSYNGQVNVKCDLTRSMVQNTTQAGVKMCILWGSPHTVITNPPNSWSQTNVFSHTDTIEWQQYYTEYQEYRIVGCKIRIIPGTYIGDQADGRVLKQCHIGSSNELMTPTALSVNRMQFASDYKGYSMNNQTPEIKRYYKPYITNKRKGDAVWQITGIDNYSAALTYMYWAVSGVDSDVISLGDVQVQYYIQFRKPKMSNF